MWDELKVPLAILAGCALFLGLIGLAMGVGSAAAGPVVIVAVVALFAPFMIAARQRSSSSSHDEERRLLTRDRVVFGAIGFASALAGLYAQLESDDPSGAGILFTFALVFFFMAAVRK